MTSDALRDTFGFTPTELRLAVALVARVGEVVTREDLLIEVWGIPEAVAPRFKTRVVDMTIKRVRTKMTAYGEIKSVRGFGYRFILEDK